MKIKPTKNRILLEPIKKPEKTASGIIIQTSKEDEQSLGKVIATNKKSQFKIGTIVVFKEYSSNKYKKDDTSFFIIDEEDIIATIENEKTDIK